MKRKFVLEITETDGLTAGELTKALSRLSGTLSNGHSHIERGFVRNSAGKFIGSYFWKNVQEKEES